MPAELARGLFASGPKAVLGKIVLLGAAKGGFGRALGPIAKVDVRFPPSSRCRLTTDRCRTCCHVLRALGLSIHLDVGAGPRRQVGGLMPGHFLRFVVMPIHTPLNV